MSTSQYTSDVCVVIDDGSIWCAGDNLVGELGTGDMNPVPMAAPVRVQPPGSVSVACQ